MLREVVITSLWTSAYCDGFTKCVPDEPPTRSESAWGAPRIEYASPLIDFRCVKVATFAYPSIEE